MIYVALAVFGLIFGSFANAFIWRLHEQEQLREQIDELEGKKSSAKKLTALRTKLRDRSMLHGRSMCSHCHHELAAKDLVPLLSWVWLHGRCRYCKAKIQDNPLVEVATAVLFVASYAFWPLPLHGVGLFQFVMWLGFCVTFMILAAYDLRWFLLPNRIVFPLIGLAVLQVVVVAIIKHDAWYALDAFLGALVLSGMFWVLFQLSDGAWIGGGDVKLAIVLGMLAGTPLLSLVLLFFASVIGTLFSIPLLFQGKRGLKLHVPFGPYLLAGTVAVVLFGHSVLLWYTNLLWHY